MARGRDGLYKRDGILTFRYKDMSGQWREKSTGERDRAAGRLFKDRFQDDLKAGMLPNHMSTWRLGEAETWWKEFRRPRIAKSTWSSESYRLQHLRRLLGDKRLNEITNQDLDNYTTKRLSEGIGAWSINKEILLWSLILKKAKLWRHLNDDYRPLKTKASDIGRALSREQLRHLADIAAKRKDWEAAFYGSVLAANTGLRGGEIKKLRIGCVDLENRRLRIARSEAKSDAAARWIELNADATEAAARLLVRTRELGSTAAEHYVMPKHLSRIARGVHKGERGYDPNQHQKYWDSAWTSLMEDAGLTGFRFHDLRHTFVTQMVERGVPLGVIQAMVGHISARMLRHYTHVSSGATRKAVEIFDAESILLPAMPEQRIYNA